MNRALEQFGASQPRIIEAKGGLFHNDKIWTSQDLLHDVHSYIDA